VDPRGVVRRPRDPDLPPLDQQRRGEGRRLHEGPEELRELRDPRPYGEHHLRMVELSEGRAHGLRRLARRHRALEAPPRQSRTSADQAREEMRTAPVLALLILAGCDGGASETPEKPMDPDAAPILITHRDQVEGAVGKLVTIQG